MAFIQLKTFSKALKTKTDIQIILPTPLTGGAMKKVIKGEFENKELKELDYYSSSHKCPVLYLLHGTFGDDGDWMRFSRIESYAQNYNIAVVMPDGENSCYRNMGRGGPAYYEYLTEELPEMMKWMFPISDKREDTFIAGLSMGGSGAFSVGMSRPDLYGYVASLSGGFDMELNKEGDVWSMAFEPGEIIKNTKEDHRWLAKKIIDDKIDYPEFYMCCGTEDFIYKNNVEFKKYLDEIGFENKYHEQPGVHNWDFWDDEIQRVLEWLPIERR